MLPVDLGAVCAKCETHSSCFMARYRLKTPQANEPVKEELLCKICTATIVLQDNYYELDVIEYYK